MAGRKTKYAVSLLVNKIWNGIFQLTNYIDYKTMVVVENETQEMFVVRYDDFLIKCRDPRYKGKRRSLKEIEEAVEKAQPDFKLKQYNNLLDMIVVDPKGREYHVAYHHFVVCRYDPRSSMSLGETKVKNILRDLKIDFLAQHRFPNCKNIHTLPFDFYLPEYRTCIEYDGQQHYMPVARFGGEETFELNKLRDEIKDRFCKENKIKLIRIPYKDYKKLSKEYLWNLITK